MFASLVASVPRGATVSRSRERRGGRISRPDPQAGLALRVAMGLVGDPLGPQGVGRQHEAKEAGGVGAAGGLGDPDDAVDEEKHGARAAATVPRGLQPPAVGPARTAAKTNPARAVIDGRAARGRGPAPVGERALLDGPETAGSRARRTRRGGRPTRAGSPPTPRRRRRPTPVPGPEIGRAGFRGSRRESIAVDESAPLQRGRKRLHEPIAAVSEDVMAGVPGQVGQQAAEHEGSVAIGRHLVGRLEARPEGGPGEGDERDVTTGCGAAQQPSSRRSPASTR